MLINQGQQRELAHIGHLQLKTLGTVKVTVQMCIYIHFYICVDVEMVQAVQSLHVQETTLSLMLAQIIAGLSSLSKKKVYDTG